MITLALSALILWQLYQLLERWLLAVMMLLVILLSSCNSLQIPYPTGCHKAIRYAIYASNACVWQEI